MKIKASVTKKAYRGGTQFTHKARMTVLEKGSHERALEKGGGGENGSVF